MQFSRLSIDTSQIELDRTVLKTGRLVDRMHRLSIAFGVLDAELFDAIYQAGLLKSLKNIRWLRFSYVLSDREKVISLQRSPAEKSYEAVVSIDARSALDDSPEVIYWRKYHAGLHCLSRISEEFEADQDTRSAIAKLLRNTPNITPFPDIPVESPEKRQRYLLSQTASAGRKSGRLVVTFIKDGSRDEHQYESLFQIIKDALTPGNLGSWEGDSQNRHSADIEFSCKSITKASDSIRKVLASHAVDDFTFSVDAD